MKLEAILFIILLILGSIVALAPWTFVPVCTPDMICAQTRTAETVLGAAIAVVSLVGVFKSLE
jgi:hypothetical protein